MSKLVDLGKTLDRAAHLVFAWPIMLGLAATAFLPRAILHYYVSSMWVRQFYAVVQKTPGSSIYDQAVAANAQRGLIDIGPAEALSAVAFNLALLVAVAYAVVAVAESESRRVEVFRVLSHLRERWKILTPVIIAIAAALFYFRAIVDFAGHAYIKLATLGGPYPYIVLLLGRPWSLVTSYAVTLALVVALGIVAAAVESISIGESISWGLRGMLGKGRAGTTCLMAAALTILIIGASNLALGGTVLLIWTRSPLLDTIWYEIIYVLPLVFVMTTVTCYYLEWELASAPLLVVPFLDQLGP